MKIQMIFIRLTLFLPALLIVLAGCHSDDGQADLTNVPAEVTPRADDCEECENCCCFVELDGVNSASLLFCGTEDGASACSEMPSCGTITGGGQLITLSVDTPRKLFCMGLNAPFRIWNVGMNDVDIIVSCTTESGIPQTIMIHLDAGDRAFITTDGDCEIDEC